MAEPEPMEVTVATHGIQTVHVPHDCLTLNDAINRAREIIAEGRECTIQIAEGSYPSPPIFGDLRGVRFVGAGKERTRLTGSFHIGAHCRGSLSHVRIESEPDAVKLVSSDWEFEDCRFTAASNSMWFGGSCTGAHVTIRRCTIGGTPENLAQWAIFHYGSGNNELVVEDSEIMYANSGVTVYLDNRATLTDCTIHHCKTPLFLRGTSQTHSTNVVFQHNTKVINRGDDASVKLSGCSYEDNESPDPEEGPGIEMDDLPVKAAGKLI